MIDPINFSMDDIDKIADNARNYGVDYNNILGWTVCVIRNPLFHHTNRRHFKPVLAHRAVSYPNDPLKYPEPSGYGILTYMSFNSYKVAYEYCMYVRIALYSEHRNSLDNYRVEQGKTFTQACYHVVNTVSKRSAVDWLEYDNRCSIDLPIPENDDYLIKIEKINIHAGDYEQLVVNTSVLSSMKQYNSIIHKLTLLNQYREQLLVDIYAIIKHYTKPDSVQTVEDLAALFEGNGANHILRDLVNNVNIPMDYIGTEWFNLKGTFSPEFIYDIDLFTTQETSSVTKAREELFKHLVVDMDVYNDSLDKYYGNVNEDNISSNNQIVKKEPVKSSWFNKLFKKLWHH